MKQRLVLLTVLLTALTAFSSTWLDVNFESDIVGTNPVCSYSIPGGSSTTTAATASAHVWVVASSPIGTGQALEFVDNDAVKNVQATYDILPVTNGMLSSLRFDFTFSPLRTDGSAANQIYAAVTVTNGNPGISSARFFSMQLFDNGTVRARAGALSGGMNLNSILNVVSGTVYKVSLFANDTAGQITYTDPKGNSATNTLGPDSVAFWIDGGGYNNYLFCTNNMASALSGTTNGLSRVGFGSTTMVTNLFYAIDNIKVTDVNYVSAPGTSEFLLTVNSGTGGGSYTNGQQVGIEANPVMIPELTFDRWTGDIQYVADIYSSSTTVTMPAQAIAVTATYRDFINPPASNVVYMLTVNSGSGSGSYSSGAQVAISANAPASGKVFDQWTGDTQAVANASSSSTTVTMPAANVTLTANYKDAMARAAFVTIGHPGNAADTTGYGAVGYTYQISATEVTIAEFSASGAGNGNENYWNDGTHTVGANAPVGYISLYEAMKYCNWLTSGDVNSGAYQFSGGVYQSTDRASAITTYGTVYALPTENEWYKAAYFKTNASSYSLYANGTADVPTQGGGATGWNYNYVNAWPNYTRDTALGTMEQNGTYNMMGNVWEWMEESNGVVRGGCYIYSENDLRSSYRYFVPPVDENYSIGFRVVAIVGAFSSNTVYTLTVNGGSGSGTYTNTQVVEISADAPVAGKVFDQWTGDTQYVASVSSSSTTVTMPSGNVTLTANYKDAVVYSVVYADAARPDDSGDGASWATAKKTIQAAVDAVTTTGTVWVTNGVYNTGSAVTPGETLPNRVVATNAIVIRSVNGPAVTIIQGHGPIGSNAVRGVYLSGNAQLLGFTVENGDTLSSGNNPNLFGGGIYCYSGSVVSNCVIRNNSAQQGVAGGVYLHLSGNLLCNSIIESNRAWGGGGVAFGDAGTSVARNCRIVKNQATIDGGGVHIYHSGILENCLIADNAATNRCGGVFVDSGSMGADIVNCTIAGNIAPLSSGYCYVISGARVQNSIIQGSWGWAAEWWNNGGSFEYSVATPLPSGTGNTTNNPLFADSDYRLSAGSPCIDAGNNSYVSTASDLDGNPRIAGGTVDMGAYEAPALPTYTITTTAGANGSISPTNPVVVQGSSQTFSVQPAAGYNIASLTVDGNPVAVVSSYTFTDVQSVHTIAATFAAVSYTLTVNGGSGSGSYTNGATISVSADAAASGYAFSGWAVNPAAYTNRLANGSAASTTFRMPATNVILTANYRASVVYADAARPDDSGDGASWATAKKTIQAAVGAVTTNGTVWVTNGVYNTGSTLTPGGMLLNRVVVTNAIVIRSMNGPEVTVIQGQGPIGTNAVRGVYLSGGAQLIGFTVENGATRSILDQLNAKGGGIYGDSSSVSNCVVKNNAACEGGGIYITGSGSLVCNSLIESNRMSATGGGGVTLQGNSPVMSNCRIVGNQSANVGGGVFLYHSGTIENCLVADNAATKSAGGVYVDWGSLGAYIVNCTIAGNTAPSYGGLNYVISGATVRNSIIRGNTGGEWTGGSYTYCATYPLPSGTGNTTNNPLFADSDYRLGAGSPCIDAGNNSYVSTVSDLDGNPRIVGGTVDMGAYELSVTRLLLTVSSGYGSSSPADGSHYYAEGTVVICAVESVVLVNGTNYTCVGWTGTGSVPATGNNNETAAIQLTAADSSITWIWQPSGDRDSDGIPDTWAYQYYGNATGVVAMADDDNDGYTNYQEYRFGTDPTDPQSKFSFSCRISPETKRVYLSFATVAGRVYTVEERASIVSGPWEPWGWFDGDGGTENITIPIKGSSRYFRVTVDMW